MTNQLWDILIIGGTGYTGQFVLDYLKTQKSSLGLRICLGARSVEKAVSRIKGLTNSESVYLDVTDEPSVIGAVKRSRVVISLAGPWWANGATVVRVCARYGVHYLDLTGEMHWVAKMIDEYDYLAHKTRACIIPCAGFDSIPSDLAVYLSTKTLEKQLSRSDTLSIKSACAVRWKIAGLSGGSRATVLSRYEQVPPEKRFDGTGWQLSPIPGPPRFSAVPKFLYSLPYVRPIVYGGFFFMSPVNEPIVRRSWGLREAQRREAAIKCYRGYTVRHLPQPAHILWGYVKPGEGPPVEKSAEGWFELTNISEAEGVVVKSLVKGDGDPSYFLTAWMVVECAILLLDPSNLTPLGRQGGILTATTAFGDKLAPALEGTGRIETQSAVLVEQESKKTR
ncbi:hypothetical protein RhiJN_12404 [Ceratobasidium sp. AG-Ba]|nr:hypothetical protein RhiJN_12404 [Ceratobasidium sp. AG-Ba]QRW13006.1 hypothetical protein RhiLY_12005 [Ceratobasidium sp. AG-Ba]